MNPDKPEITVIIPAYNEGGRIAPTLREMVTFLGENKFSYELIVVDDGSRDATFDVVYQFYSEIPQLSIIRHPKNLGKGMAVKSGFIASKGDIVFFSDADHSTPISEIPKFLEHISSGNDIVIGSRALPGSEIAVHQPWYRENMGRFFNLLVRLITVRGLHDTQCGFKCFKREKCKRIFDLQRLSGFCFDVELLFLARKDGLKIAEVPVKWRNSVETRVSTLKDSLRMFRDLVRIRCNSILGKYK